MALHFLLDGPGSPASSATEGAVLALSGAEAKHALVRRVRPGESVTVGDGAGVWLDAVVLTAVPGDVSVRVTGRRVDDAPAPRIILAQALAKGDRDELAVQAACELGVDEIVPWQASRSVSRWEGVKAAKGRERWASIVREAAKQAHRSRVPLVAEAESTSRLAERAAMQRMLLLEPTATAPLSGWQSDGRDLLLVVGPEGGIAPEEIALLTRAGAETVRLGDTVLRTSTAGPAAIALLSAAFGRW